MSIRLSPKSPPDVRRLGVIAGAGVGAAAVLLVAGHMLGRPEAPQVQRYSHTRALRTVQAARHAAAQPSQSAQAAAQVAASLGSPQGNSTQDVTRNAAQASPKAPAAAQQQQQAQAGMALLSAGDDTDFGILPPVRSQYSYNADNRRDPFQSLVKGDFQMESGQGGQPLVDVGDLRLMGVMSSNNEVYAMVEDSKHHGFTLRVGDPVLNGRVTRIQPDCITVNLSSYGETETVRLRLNPNTNNGK